MKKNMILVVLCASVAVWASQTASAPVSSGAAPAFTLSDSNGKNVSLADFKGKYVVLEWWNYECPYVIRHYGGNMQKLQKQFTGEGVVWLSICSSAPGKQGHVDGPKANEVMKEKGAAISHVLLDPQGTVGKLYGAKTSPQMVLITPKGDVVYNGGMDNAPRARTQEEMDKAENWLLKAYGQHKAGQPITNPSERPYGCGIKYP